jgi:hypothetical protein
MASEHGPEGSPQPLHASDAPPLLKGFRPISALWESVPPHYPSQQSAQWAIRQLRRPLAEAGAIALHRGRMFIHLDRFAAVVEHDALEKARNRYCKS